MHSGLASRLSLTLTDTPLWHLVQLQQIGAMHVAAGADCEDAIHLVDHGDGFVAVVADGVSSSKAARSGEGARLAVRHTADIIGRGLDAGLDPQQAIAEAFSSTHNLLTQRAAAARLSPIVYACTLAALVVQPQSITAGHIGDSCLFHCDGKRLTRLATGPVSKAPYTIVLPHWRDGFAVQTVTSPHVQAVILATDGCEELFIGKEPDDARFTNPDYATWIMDRVRTLRDPIALAHDLLHLLGERDLDHGDDRTLLLACKKEAAR